MKRPELPPANPSAMASVRRELGRRRSASPGLRTWGRRFERKFVLAGWIFVSVLIVLFIVIKVLGLDSD